MSSSSQTSKSAENNASLNDVLNIPALRTELVAMVALCSDAMRRDLLATFEPVIQLQNSKDIQSGDNPLIDFEDLQVGPQSQGQDAQKAEQAYLQSTRTQALRRAAVTFFDKWQIDVLRRLGEVLSVQPNAIRKARADAKARAQAALKARQDTAYLNWANGFDDKADISSTLDREDVLLGLKPKIPTFSKDEKILVLNSVLLLLLSLEQYTAHSRVLMVNLTRVLQLSESILNETESKVAESLLTSAAMSAEQSTKRQASEDALARRWKIGLATVAGAALIGVTGGLAAPLLAASVGGIMGGLGLGAVASLLGPLATNMVLVGGLFGAYGGKMTGEIMEKYAQEIRDFKFLPVASQAHTIPSSASTPSEEAAGLAELQDENNRKVHKLRVAIGISGSITTPDDFVHPWTVFSDSRIEAFGLRWETDALMALGKRMSEVLQEFAWDFAKFQLLSMVLAGLWPFGFLRAAKSLDSPFAIAKTRSDKAGKVLADALVNHVQGNRPVVLVGYGLGARVIYSCLLQLADLNAFGLVESVVLMGAPAPSDAPTWRRIRAVVSGRIANVFSADDIMLGFLYRASSAQMGIAGVQEVLDVAGVENFDFTDMVSGHDMYSSLVGTILQRIGFADLDSDVVRQQQEELKEAENGKLYAKSQRQNDQTLAKEGDRGEIVLVDSETKRPLVHQPSKSKKRAPFVDPPAPSAHDSEDEDTDHQIRLQDNDEPMSMLDPEPEPDYGADRETISFGAGVRGFNLEWDNKRG